MIPPEDLIEVDAWRQRLLDGVRALEAIEVDLGDAPGHAAAEDVVAAEDLPPFANSAVDGYAVLAADLERASADEPASLRVEGEIAAGSVSYREVIPGTAQKIMTGAPVPPGADAVVMVEWTERRGERVLVRRPATRGLNIRPAGESVSRGERVLERGAAIRAPEAGLLASLGRTRISVVRRPRVAVLSTGTELVPVDRAPGPGQIRDSNRVQLLAAARAAGAVPVDLGRAPDDEGEILSKVKSGAASADLLVTTGGVSVGDYDATREAFRRLGTVGTYRVRMRPGKPQAFGHVEGTPVFGLPGNPVSSYVVFDQFVRPAIRKMAGFRKWTRDPIRARLVEPVRKARGLAEFVRAVLSTDAGGAWTARAAGPQGSGIQMSLVRANGLLLLPPEPEAYAAGESVWAERWDE
jgi:molybdopterin molybdotransferase